MYTYCFFKNKITKSDKPLIKLDDISILRGFAAFDFMRIYNGKLFMFDEHFLRFSNTAKEMGLKIPYSQKETEEILNTLVRKNKDLNFHVRFVLTGGDTRDGIKPGEPILYIIFEKLIDLPKKLYKNGAKLMTNEHIRTLPTAKNSNYLNAVLLQKEKEQKGAVEILYINKGEVLECSTSNIFIVKDDKLITPKDRILKGVTRLSVIKIAQKIGLKVLERKIKLSELKNSDEVFITATNKKVLPIVQIDNLKINKGMVGNVSLMLNKEYNKLIK